MHYDQIKGAENDGALKNIYKCIIYGHIYKL